MARPGENVPKLLPAEGPRGVMQVRYIGVFHSLYAIVALGYHRYLKVHGGRIHSARLFSIPFVLFDTRVV